MSHPLTVYMVGGITVVNADGSQETVHGALLKGDLDHPAAIQRAGAMLYREVELVAARDALPAGEGVREPTAAYGTPRCRRTWQADERTPGVLYHPRQFDCLCTRSAGHETDEDAHVRLCRCECGETAVHEATQAFDNDKGRR